MASGNSTLVNHSHDVRIQLFLKRLVAVWTSELTGHDGTTLLTRRRFTHALQTVTRDTSKYTAICL
jgi:hypothetical protein